MLSNELDGQGEGKHQQPSAFEEGFSHFKGSVDSKNIRRGKEHTKSL
jgi:hypothetical protein